MNTQRHQVGASPKPSFTPAPSGLLQRKCACGNHTSAGGECKECGKKTQTLQRASRSPRWRGTEGEGVVPPIVHEVLRSSGQPLDPAMRAFMEPRFGHDFSQVRVHADAKAVESAQAVNALAYTVGHNVVFDAGRYQPGTQQGRQMVAHELAHVVQQEVAPGGLSRLIIGSSNESEETEANQASEAVEAGTMASPLTRAGQALRRQGGGAPAAAPAANTWAGCAAGNVGDLNRELTEATRWVQDAITDLHSSSRPRRTTNALFR